MDSIAQRCSTCPRNCDANRKTNTGYCGVGSTVKVAKAYSHKWEEPCISGTNGSGTVFFSGCNLRCIYCQNHDISQQYYGMELSTQDLCKVFLSLQEKSVHNINLVSPSHYTMQIREALMAASGKLTIPVVYNSNGYDSERSLELLDGLIDVYLPDFKYFSNATSEKYSNAPDYFETVTKAIPMMYRQVGKLQLDENGIIKKGLVIRHLILPGHTGESIRILDWIKSNLPSDGILVSLMSQYTPLYKAQNHSELNRRIIRREYEKVVNHFLKLGFSDGYIQERDSAEEKYVPDFDLEGLIHNNE